MGIITTTIIITITNTTTTIIITININNINTTINTTINTIMTTINTTTISIPPLMLTKKTVMTKISLELPASLGAEQRKKGEVLGVSRPSLARTEMFPRSGCEP